MNIKIAFFDIDGTIKNHVDGSISESTRRALGQLKDQGVILAAATGRPMSMCDEIRSLGFDVFITSNGGHVKYGEQVIHKVPMNPETLQSVMHFAARENHALSFYTEELSISNVQNANILTALKETLSLDDYPRINEGPLQEEVFLLCLFADDEMAKKYIQAFPQLSFRRWHPYILNVLEEDISKSLAIQKVLEYFNLHPSEAVAFGDGNNDLDMLEMVGLGIAMGNAGERLKIAADYVTKTSTEDGIEFALKTLGIIKTLHVEEILL